MLACIRLDDLRHRAALGGFTDMLSRHLLTVITEAILSYNYVVYARFLSLLILEDA